MEYTIDANGMYCFPYTRDDDGVPWESVLVLYQEEFEAMSEADIIARQDERFEKFKTLRAALIARTSG